MKSKPFLILGSLLINLLLAVGVLVALFLFSLTSSSEKLDIASQQYHEGEQANTIFEVEKHFNKALTLYLELEQEYHPTYGDGKLYYNIGNTYFQLEQYPWAVLYYEKAKTLMPFNSSVSENLKLAKQKLGLGDDSKTQEVGSLLFMTSLLSLPQRLQLLFWMTLIMMAITTLAIWRWTRWTKGWVIVCAFFMAYLAASLIYTQYFSPIKAVVIEAAVLRVASGDQYSKVTSEPIPAGSTVEIIGTDDKRPWIKVISPKGTLGYIDKASVRVI